MFVAVENTWTHHVCVLSVDEITSSLSVHHFRHRSFSKWTTDLSKSFLLFPSIYNLPPLYLLKYSELFFSLCMLATMRVHNKIRFWSTGLNNDDFLFVCFFFFVCCIWWWWFCYCCSVQGKILHNDTVAIPEITKPLPPETSPCAALDPKGSSPVVAASRNLVPFSFIIYWMTMLS